jgi:hypothetical protein
VLTAAERLAVLRATRADVRDRLRAQPRCTSAFLAAVDALDALETAIELTELEQHQQEAACRVSC